MKRLAQQLKCGRAALIGCALLLALGAVTPSGGQSAIYSRGQDISPAFEGWEEQPDGSFDMIFGYMNRNQDEHFHVPVGPNNSIEPGGPDQGQPTYFYPNRNRYIFRARVPKDFGKKELVWTLTSNGKTNRAYATLKDEFVLDPIMIQGDFGGDRQHTTRNKAPVIKFEGAADRTVKVGEPLALTAHVVDDSTRRSPAGMNFPRNNSAQGLRVAWSVYRGTGTAAAFEPQQFKVYPDFRKYSNSPWSPGWIAPEPPADSKYPVTVTFRQPGTYVLRLIASDGGLNTYQNVNVTVMPTGL